MYGVTGGVAIEDIKNDTKRLAERNINTLVGYTNEGLVNPTKDELDKFTDFILESIKQLTEGQKEVHYALKLTAFIDMDALKRINEAQKQFSENILRVNYDPSQRDTVMTPEQFENNLRNAGITDYSQ